MLKNDENFLAADIVVTPPIDGDISDEDSGPEDEVELLTTFHGICY